MPTTVAAYIPPGEQGARGGPHCEYPVDAATCTLRHADFPKATVTSSTLASRKNRSAADSLEHVGQACSKLARESLVHCRGFNVSLSRDLGRPRGRSTEPFVETPNVPFVVKTIHGHRGLEPYWKRHRFRRKIRDGVGRRQRDSTQTAAIRNQIHGGDDR